MHTIRLKVNDKVYERFLWLLSKFNKEEIEVINDLDDFESAKEYLSNELNDIESGNAKFLTQKEVDSRLDKLHK